MSRRDDPSAPPPDTTRVDGHDKPVTTWERFGLVYLILVAILIPVSIVLSAAGNSWLGYLTIALAVVPAFLLLFALTVGLFVGGLMGLTKTVILIPKTLFLRTRMRLSDLMLIVALLGNAEGLLLAWLLPGSRTPKGFALSFTTVYLHRSPTWSKERRACSPNPWLRSPASLSAWPRLRCWPVPAPPRRAKASTTSRSTAMTPGRGA